MKEVGSGAPKASGKMMATFRADGKTSTPFELKPVGGPSVGAVCKATGQSPYMDWEIDAKGCAKNEGLLTQQTTGLDVLSDTGQTYATFKFAPGAASGTAVGAAK
jgi:hypothetical protein